MHVGLGDAYLTTLLVIHVLGAVVGFGPTFAFAVLGPLAGKSGPQGGVAILESMEAIEKKLVVPVAAVVQPLTGVLMIFRAGFNHDFFQHKWLVASIGIYVVAFYLAVFVQTPAIVKMIHTAKEGGGGSPEFQKLTKKTSTLGPILTIMLVVIVVLMVWKPGGTSVAG